MTTIQDRINKVNEHYHQIQTVPVGNLTLSTIDDAKGVMAKARNAIYTIKKKAKLEALDQKTLASIEKWKKKNPSAEAAYAFPIEATEKTRVVQKAEMVKTSRKIINIIGEIFRYIALACGVACIPMIFLSPSGIATLPFAVSLGIPGAALAALGGTFFTHIIDYALSKFEVLKEKRLYDSANFKNFIAVYLQKDGFQASKEMLLDAKLHRIYKSWSMQAATILV